jgi:hypothetical protein
MPAINLRDLRKLNTVVGASETDLPVAEFSSDVPSSINFRLDVVCSGVTVTSGITVQLQSRALGGDFIDLASANSSVAISGNGTFSIVLHVQRAADQVDLPLRKTCRLVVTTGAGDAVTFDNVSVNQG